MIIKVMFVKLFEICEFIISCLIFKNKSTILFGIEESNLAILKANFRFIFIIISRFIHIC